MYSNTKAAVEKMKTLEDWAKSPAARPAIRVRPQDRHPTSRRHHRDPQFKIDAIKWMEEQIAVNWLLDPPGWQRDRRHKRQLLTAEELAAALWVIECHWQERPYMGLTYPEFAERWVSCEVWRTDLPQVPYAYPCRHCHRNKVAAMLASLVKLRIIEQVPGHSRGKCYKRCE